MCNHIIVVIQEERKRSNDLRSELRFFYFSICGAAAREDDLGVEANYRCHESELCSEIFNKSKMIQILNIKQIKLFLVYKNSKLKNIQ